jgi:hypothetical protein
VCIDPVVVKAAPHGISILIAEVAIFIVRAFCVILAHIVIMCHDYGVREVVYESNGVGHWFRQWDLFNKDQVDDEPKGRENG